jgi:hypothetical protein
MKEAKSPIRESYPPSLAFLYSNKNVVKCSMTTDEQKAILKQIVENHDNFLDLHSKDGQELRTIAAKMLLRLEWLEKGKGQRLLTPETAERWHHAAKLIEVDGVNAYWACRERYGEDIANVLIIAFLRRNFNPNEQFPIPEEVTKKTNYTLCREGLMIIDDEEE